jgi:hypothetical protein
MAPTFLDVPVEIRLHIYSLIFEQRTAILSATRRADDHYSLVPAAASPLHRTQRSSQLLRVCKTILHEARPILYANTEFRVVAQAFAGRLPCSMTNGHPAAPHIQRLTWQLECDLLKHLYETDIDIDSTSLSQLKSLEIRCRAEAWRDSFMGEWCDRESFVTGRKQMINYASILKRLMTGANDKDVSLVEDQRQLNQGRVILRLLRNQTELRDSV